MNYAQAHQALLDGDVDSELAHSLLNLAQSYGSVEIYHLRDGDDVWGSHIKLNVSFTKTDSVFYRYSPGFTVKFEEVKHY